jgi:hypothetical protein
MIFPTMIAHQIQTMKIDDRKAIEEISHLFRKTILRTTRPGRL